MVEVKHDKDGWPITYPDRHSISYGVQLEERVQVLEKAVGSLGRYVDEIVMAISKKDELTHRNLQLLDHRMALLWVKIYPPEDDK